MPPNTTFTSVFITNRGTKTVTIDAALAGGGKEIEGRTLQISPGAKATWSSGDIGGFPGAVIANAGAFETTFDGNLFNGQPRKSSD